MRGRERYRRSRQLSSLYHDHSYVRVVIVAKKKQFTQQQIILANKNAAKPWIRYSFATTTWFTEDTCAIGQWNLFELYKNNLVLFCTLWWQKQPEFWTTVSYVTFVVKKDHRRTPNCGPTLLT